MDAGKSSEPTLVKNPTTAERTTFASCWADSRRGTEVADQNAVRWKRTAVGYPIGHSKDRHNKDLRRAIRLSGSGGQMSVCLRTP